MKATTNITLNEAAAYRYDLHTMDSIYHAKVYCSVPLTYEQVLAILPPPNHTEYGITVIEQVLNPVSQKYEVTMYLKPKDYYYDKEYVICIDGIYVGTVKINKRKHYSHADLIEELNTQLNVADMKFRLGLSDDAVITFRNADYKVIADGALLTGYTLASLSIKTFKYTLVDSKGRVVFERYDDTLLATPGVYEFVPKNITGAVHVVKYRLGMFDAVSMENNVYHLIDAV
jgi:hypothetical protein